MKNLLLIFGFLVLFISCHKKLENFIEFTENQPLNVAEISEIPKSFFGKYISSDSTFILIEKDKIIQRWFNEDKTSILEKDSVSNVTFYKNYVVDNYTKQKAKYIIKNDSIFWKMQNFDTIFIKDKVLKLYKDALILNSNIDDKIYIDVYKKENNQIRQFNISSKEDFEKLNKEIKIEGKLNFNETDTTITINPSKAQFRKLLRLKNYSYESIYKKL